MSAAGCARHLCIKCGSTMANVEAVAVLASLEGHTIYECVWCRHVMLVQESAEPAGPPAWLLAAPVKVRRSVTSASGLCPALE